MSRAELYRTSRRGRFSNFSRCGIVSRLFRRLLIPLSIYTRADADMGHHFISVFLQFGRQKADMVAPVVFVIVVVFAAAQASYLPHAAHAGVSHASRQQDDFGNYNFKYEIADGVGATNGRWEAGDGHGNKRGSYTITDIDGRARRVDYVADDHGFRAVVKTNEPGTAASAPAAVVVASPYAGPVAQGVGVVHKTPVVAAPAYAAPVYAAPYAPYAAGPHGAYAAGPHGAYAAGPHAAGPYVGALKPVAAYGHAGPYGYGPALAKGYY